MDGLEIHNRNQNESEVVKSHSLTLSTPREITSAADTKYLADDLARFIRENKLFNNIQGKEFVNVEGWQYAGSRLGILPTVEALERIHTSDDKEIAYMCRVVLYDLHRGVNVGSGHAFCSNKEHTKKSYQEYAIASMAQTRAIGKAYRNILAWIIRAAGYQPTPAEEMDQIIASVEEVKEPEPMSALQKAVVEGLLTSKYVTEEIADKTTVWLGKSQTEDGADRMTARLLEIITKAIPTEPVPSPTPNTPAQ